MKIRSTVLGMSHADRWRDLVALRKYANPYKGKKKDRTKDGLRGRNREGSKEGLK
jgi:hypothetical protein